MESSFATSRFDIFEIYCRYCDIISAPYSHGSEGCISNEESQEARFSREALNQLLKLVESRLHPRISILEEIYKLMLRLDLLANLSEFSRFYDFVFFISRENGQKNITVSKAVMAWRLVLAGRFQFLNQWCKFVEDNQRHNISEDTWRLVLSFTRCIQDNLEGYDPEGAWPILIDEFVEHMYRSRASNNNPNSFCNCSDSDSHSLEDPLHRLSSLTCLKRRLCDRHDDNNSIDDGFTMSKRRQISRGVCVHNEEEEEEENASVGAAANECTEDLFNHNNNNNSSSVGCSKSPCWVEGCLSKGFAGLLSDRPSLQFSGVGN